MAKDTSMLLPVNIGVTAHLIGYLDLIGNTHLSCYWYTHLSGYLVRALHRLLVTLPVCFGLALGSSGITSLSSFCFTFNMTMVVMNPLMGTLNSV